MEEILSNYGHIGYGVAILFGGIAGVKYLPTTWATKYRFLAFSTLVAILFIFIEVMVQKDFDNTIATKYLQTYFIVAVCYQLFIKQLFAKIGLVDKEPDSKPYSAPKDTGLNG